MALTDRHKEETADALKAQARFGQPEDVSDLLNRYGTYNIQPTNEQENPFPAIAQGLPKAWRGREVTKEELERLS